MACNVTLTGIALDCVTNLSGIKAIYLANDASVGNVTVSEEQITAIDASAGTFYEYIPAKNTGSLTKTLTKDESTGVMYYTNEVVAQFNKMDTPKRKEISNSDSYGFIVGGSNGFGDYKEIPVGLCGRVKVKIIGPINFGDLIEVSSIDGVGRKSDFPKPGYIIGKCLERKDSLGTERVTMQIMLA